jgi:glycosyltransferase involved in cell wall biosynthesis
LRVAFVYPNPRGDLPERVRRGEAPDTPLLGLNHLEALGVDAFLQDSVLRRSTPKSGVAHRASWYGREVALPWELRDADVIVTPLATLLPLFARVRRRPRVLLVAYHLVSAWDRAGELRRRLQRASLAAAAGILTSSAAARDGLLERTGLPPHRVRTATLGVDAGWWQPTPLPEDGYVLTVGRDLARDYQTFAHALEGLGLRGVIVAKEENLRGVRLPENVEVRLNIGPREVRELYAGARCVVVPVRQTRDPRGTENSGTVALLEAMACGRPVVVTDRPYLRDYVSPETTVTVEPGDPQSLRAAIESVCADPARAEALGTAARASVVASHTTRHFAERLAAALKDLPWHA